MKKKELNFQKEFVERLSYLRSRKGVSAREMSLQLGQSAGYMNRIENNKMLPSLPLFMNICEYLDITPNDFFSYYSGKTDEEKEILYLYRQISKKRQNHIKSILHDMAQE